MKHLFAVTFVWAVCGAKDLQPSENSDVDIFLYAGDDDNNLTMIDPLEPVDKEFIKKYTSDPDNNGYWLYTRANPVTPQILQYKNDSTVKNSNFNKDKTTVVLSHGWRGSCNSEFNIMLTEAFLQDQDVNVVVFDWSALAGKNYMTAKNGVAGVGRALGQFILWLETLGASCERLHLVGFSLGGHLVGIASRETGGNVQRITALDPAGPFWGIDPERLKINDGKYVEVIHTSLFLGYYQPCGHTDFYPNGGRIQPGCVSDACAHRRAYNLMAATIQLNHLKANECENLVNVQLNRCNGNVELIGNSYLMPKSPGIYRVNTQRSYPFDIDEITFL